MKIDKLRPGMIVYDVSRKRSTVGVWRVEIVSVDVDERVVVASWNGNRRRPYYEATWSKWRMEAPKLVPMAMGGYRLARRGEAKSAVAES